MHLRAWRAAVRPCALLLAAALLAACGGGDGDRRGTGPIVFADSRDTSRGSQVKRLVAAWNARHPAERVEMVELAESSDDHRAQVVARAQDAAAAREAGKSGAPCFDVTTADLIHTAEYAHGGYIEPLGENDFDHEAFLREPIDSVRYKGRLWGIPLRSDVGLLYYRKDVLAASGVAAPVAWEDLRNQARTIAPSKGMQGYVTQLDQYEGFTVNTMEQIWDATGGGILGPDGAVVATPSTLREGFERLVQGVREGWIPKDATDFNEERSRIAFQDGRALFMRNWTYAYELLHAADSPVAKTFGVAKLPTPSALGGWNLTLSSCSTKQRTALRFMQFLTSEANQRRLFTGAGFAPSRKALYEDAALLRRYPHLSVIGAAIEEARDRGPSPYYHEVSNTFQANLHGVLTRPERLEAGLSGLREDLYRAAVGR
ncbi:ABC transporter substrate-binding protein [Actinomadura sp. 21ATH]|uniref:ABC transporter substrate-binding protein n=1 Tax=Actinomadura sp. 21ATH TaxID=1735444 RepID=UPI0035BF5505